MTTTAFLGDVSIKKPPTTFPVNRPLYVFMDTCLHLKCDSLITMKQLEIIIDKMAD